MWNINVPARIKPGLYFSCWLVGAGGTHRQLSSAVTNCGFKVQQHGIFKHVSSHQQLLSSCPKNLSCETITTKVICWASSSNACTWLADRNTRTSLKRKTLEKTVGKSFGRDGEDIYFLGIGLPYRRWYCTCHNSFVVTCKISWSECQGLNINCFYINLNDPFTRFWTCYGSIAVVECKISPQSSCQAWG